MARPGRTPISERVLHELRHRIATGFYPANSYLPAERLLAREFNTSRTSVSTALAALAAERLVEQCRGRGTRILPPSERLRDRPVAIIHDAGSRKEAWPETFYIIQGAEETLSRLSYPSCRVPVRSGDPLPQATRLAERHVGVLMVEAAGRENLAIELERRRVPFVVANLEADLPVTATCVDHYRVFHEATVILIRMGHRRIAFVGRPPERAFYARAHAAYAEALREAGIEADPELVGVCEAPSALTAYFAARRLLNLNDPPSAFVAGRDVFAEGIFRAAAETGRTVGRDVSVIGFDDVSWPSERPILTTFREPCREMGGVAAEMLVERIVTGWKAPERRVLEAPFVLRRSVGPYIESAAAEGMPSAEGGSAAKRIFLKGANTP